MDIRETLPLAPKIRYDLRRGLTTKAAEESRKKFGTNVLTEKKRAGFFIQFIRNFNDPIIKILLGALIVNILVTLGHVNYLECGGIAAAILISTLVSTVSEYTSAKAFETLLGQADDTLLTVLRNGERIQLCASQIAVGDVITLTSGFTVPADGIVISGSLSADESPLTGESDEKKKTAAARFAAGSVGELSPDDIRWDLEDPNEVFRGSRITEGEAEILILRVGDSTFYGGMASDVQESARPSPLKERLAGLAKSVSFLGYVAAAAIAFAYLFNVFVLDSGMNTAVILGKIKNPAFAIPALIRALTVAISILVVAVPEGLPMMITVVLSSNMKRMLRSGVLVRRLVGIETAGNLNILFTDKTGTLTAGKLEVASVLSAESAFESMTALKKTPSIHSAVLQNQAACAPLGRGNATDRAMSSFVGKHTRASSVAGRVPFSSERRYASAVLNMQGRTKTYVRGAPEVLLPSAVTYLSDDGRVRPITPTVTASVRSRWQNLATSSHRVIALMEYDGENLTECGAFQNLTFIALIAIRDRIRPDARGAVESARDAGIQTVMITGDNPITAEAIARECEIISESGPSLVLTGAEMAKMTDAELSLKIPEIAVVARALPTDKSRLVRLSQGLGLVVGMTGDGINDAPALRAADVGFSMGSGTDAAREASAIVITDDRFSSITKAVLFGRTIFLSIRKFIVFQLMMNLSAVGVSLIGPFIGIENPVTVIQMLWVNIIMDTLGALAFAGEPSLREYMRHPPRRREEPLLSSDMIESILLTGGYTLALCIWFLKSPLMHRIFYRGDETYYLTVFFSMFIFCGIFNSFNARTNRLNIFAHLSGNKPFIFIMMTVAIVQLMILFFGGEMFRCVPLTTREITISALVAFTVIPADFIRKLITKRCKKSGAV